MGKDIRFWEEEHKKCVASPYYFYINYVKIVGPDGELMSPYTRMSEEQFNKAYYGNTMQKDL